MRWLITGAWAPFEMMATRGRCGAGPRLWDRESGGDFAWRELEFSELLRRGGTGWEPGSGVRTLMLFRSLLHSPWARCDPRCASGATYMRGWAGGKKRKENVERQFCPRRQERMYPRLTGPSQSIFIVPKDVGGGRVC